MSNSHEMCSTICFTHAARITAKGKTTQLHHRNWHRKFCSTVNLQLEHDIWRCKLHKIVKNTVELSCRHRQLLVSTVISYDLGGTMKAAGRSQSKVAEIFRHQQVLAMMPRPMHLHLQKLCHSVAGESSFWRVSLEVFGASVLNSWNLAPQNILTCNIGRNINTPESRWYNRICQTTWKQRCPRWWTLDYSRRSMSTGLKGKTYKSTPSVQRPKGMSKHMSSKRKDAGSAGVWRRPAHLRSEVQRPKFNMFNICFDMVK